MKGIDGVKFYKLTGFWSKESQMKVYDSDGVHLNSEGNKKYYNNLRGVLVSALKQL